MSRWDERFTEHPAIAAVHDVEALLADLEPCDPLELEVVERLKKIVDHVSVVLDEIDAGLVTPQMLDELNSAAVNTVNQIRPFSENRNAAHLEDANSQGRSPLERDRAVASPPRARRYQ